MREFNKCASHAEEDYESEEACTDAEENSQDNPTSEDDALPEMQTPPAQTIRTPGPPPRKRRRTATESLASAESPAATPVFARTPRSPPSTLKITRG